MLQIIQAQDDRIYIPSLGQRPHCRVAANVIADRPLVELPVPGASEGIVAVRNLAKS